MEYVSDVGALPYLFGCQESDGELDALELRVSAQHKVREDCGQNAPRTIHFNLKTCQDSLEGHSDSYVGPPQKEQKVESIQRKQENQCTILLTLPEPSG